MLTEQTIKNYDLSVLKELIKNNNYMAEKRTRRTNIPVSEQSATIVTQLSKWTLEERKSFSDELAKSVAGEIKQAMAEAKQTLDNLNKLSV